MVYQEFDLNKLSLICKEIRSDVFRMAYFAGGGHIAPALSTVEILASLYFGNILNYDPNNPAKKDRDRFIMSKGHACLALYAVLARAGFFPKEDLYTFCQEGSYLGGHPNMHEVPGIEASTGALGHGINFSVGLALAGKIDKSNDHIFVLIGDGECQEGTIWEAALFASEKKLDNLTVVIDYNKLQAMDRLENIITMDSMFDKWAAFGFECIEVNGHDLEQVTNVLKQSSVDKPRAIIANTVKGKGVSFMENEPIWHYRMPDEQELEIVLSELDINEMELLRP